MGQISGRHVNYDRQRNLDSSVIDQGSLSRLEAIMPVKTAPRASGAASAETGLLRVSCICGLLRHWARIGGIFSSEATAHMVVPSDHRY